MSNIRKPCVAGYFYPENATELKQAVDGFLTSTLTITNAQIAIVPHAGYVYSGETAGKVISSIQVPNRVILLGPKHTYYGPALSISGADAWQTPLGEVLVDTQMVNVLKGLAPTFFVVEDDAHKGEHSLEVQLPFLIEANPNVKITPIAVGQHSFSDLDNIGRLLAQAILKSQTDDDEGILTVVSTDMSHQIPEAEAKQLDMLAIDAILKLDAQALYNTVMSRRISMCGIMPATAALAAGNLMGAKKATLVEYTSSARATGDTKRVVGYAGLVINT